MFYTDGKLQYKVRVDRPDPCFARLLQQAIGGAEGKLRLVLQYFFQAWGCRGPQKYREMLLATGTEELAHLEMLATAVAINLDRAPAADDETRDAIPMLDPILRGMSPRHYLSTGLGAHAGDAEGTPFDCSHVSSNGNLAADMYANVAAEASSRLLLVRLIQMTSDGGMRDMLEFLIARDAMHQQQWLEVVEELGGPSTVLPIPNSHHQSDEHRQYGYLFLDPRIGSDRKPIAGRYAQGPSLDGRAAYGVRRAEPLGGEPHLARAQRGNGAQTEQILDDDGLLHDAVVAFRYVPITEREAHSSEASADL
jgi:Mn-containing catalase